MARQTMSAYELEGRERKAAVLVPFMLSHGFTADHARLLDEAGWRIVDAEAGLRRASSPITRAYVISILAGRPLSVAEQLAVAS